MELTKYDYVKETHLVLLSEEIELSDITVALDRIDYEDTTTSVWFKTTISAAEKTILDGLISVHDKELRRS